MVSLNIHVLSRKKILPPTKKIKVYNSQIECGFGMVYTQALRDR